MATIKEEAMAYEPPQTKNIADLNKIPVNLEVKEGTGKNKEGEDFKYKYIEIDDEQYRVPGIVLGGIKAVLKKMPHIQYVTVTKEGKGMNTKYYVMPYIEATEEKVV